jgi:hypothetical protein
MNRTFKDLVPELMGAHAVIGIPPEIAEFHIRKAVIELCERSHIWTTDIRLDEQAGVEDYPIDLEDCARVVAVNKVVMGHCLRPLTPARTYEEFRRACSAFYVKDNVTLYVPAPNEDSEQTLEINVAVKPAQDSCVLVERLYEDFAETIVEGAAFRCYSMPKQDWTNTRMAKDSYLLFRAGVGRARNRRSLNSTVGPLMMKGARF